jgi:hypothetical protein
VIYFSHMSARFIPDWRPHPKSRELLDKVKTIIAEIRDGVDHPADLRSAGRAPWPRKWPITAQPRPAISTTEAQ